MAHAIACALIEGSEPDHVAHLSGVSRKRVDVVRRHLNTLKGTCT